MNTKVNTPAKPRTLKSGAKSVKQAAPAAAKTEKVAKPSQISHAFGSSWDGASGVLNARPSKTAIDFGKFGQHLNATMTDRDRKSLAAIRAEFAKKQFARANVDAGILRRLGERGYLEHVAGSNVAADATFKLTARAFTPDAMQS